MPIKKSDELQKHSVESLALELASLDLDDVFVEINSCIGLGLGANGCSVSSGDRDRQDVGH